MLSERNRIQIRYDLMRQAGTFAIVLFVNVASVYALTVPDVRGTWTGSRTGIEQNCQDPDDNGSYSFNSSFTINSQTFQHFSGSSTGGGETESFSCTVDSNGSFTCTATYIGPGYSGTESITGSINGNTMNFSTTWQDTVGDTCNGTETGSATRFGAIPPPIVLPNPPPSPPQTHPGSDLDGDGKADVVWRNTSSGVVAIWLLNGTTIVSSGFLGGVPSEWKIAGIGDVNGDGKADVIWRNSTSGVVAVWLMDGLTITSVGFPGSTSTEWKIEQVGDVDGNGTADLVWRNTNSGVVAVWLMNGVTIGSSGFLGGVPAEWQIAGIGDVNGDGIADVIWRNSSGVVAVWVMKGLTITSVGFPGSASTDWEITGLGDVDGNGTADVVWRNTNSGAGVVWLMNGTTMVSPGSLAGKPAPWKIAQVGDVDGDGKADVIWFNTSTGEVDVWLMNGVNIGSTGSPGATSSEWEIQGGGGSTVQPPSSLTMLTVTKAGTGTGTVISSPSGINCGTTCSASFASGTPVTLTATPASGSTFAGWSGGGCSGTTACLVNLTQAINVSAIFTATLADISGVWFVRETVTATCSLAGEQETFTQRGSANVTINQNGGQVSYIPPGGTSDFIRTGQVTGNSVQFSGIFIFPVEGIEIIFTQNLATASGPISGNRIDLTGTGVARGTVVGFGQIECTGNSTATFMR